MRYSPFIAADHPDAVPLPPYAAEADDELRTVEIHAGETQSAAEAVEHVASTVRDDLLLDAHRYCAADAAEWKAIAAEAARIASETAALLKRAEAAR